MDKKNLLKAIFKKMTTVILTLGMVISFMPVVNLQTLYADGDDGIETVTLTYAATGSASGTSASCSAVDQTTPAIPLGSLIDLSWTRNDSSVSASSIGRQYHDEEHTRWNDYYYGNTSNSAISHLYLYTDADDYTDYIVELNTLTSPITADYIKILSPNASNIKLRFVCDATSCSCGSAGEGRDSASATPAKAVITYNYYKVPVFVTNLTDVTTVEGSNDTLLAVNSSFPGGSENYYWEYSLPGDTLWNRITDDLVLYSVGSSLFSAAQLASLGMSPASYEQTKFVPAGRTEGLDNTVANSFALKLSNPRVASCDGLKVRVTLKSTNGDTISNICTVTVIPAGFTGLTSLAIRRTHDIGTVLDPTDYSQFANTVSYNNGTSKYYTDRFLRFIKDGDLTLNQIESKIRTEVSSANVIPVTAHSADATYAVGDFVVYDGTSYECTTAVTAAEAFDPEKWTARNNVIHGYAYKDAEGNVHDVSHWADIDKYYYTSYTLDEIGTSNDPETGCGTLTTYTATVESGVNTLYILVPDVSNLTRSVVAEAKIEGVDLGAPDVSDVAAQWITSLDPLEVGDTYSVGVVTNQQTPMLLSVDAHDNVTTDENIVYQWYKDGTAIPGANENAIILSGTDADNGTYYVEATDEVGNTSASDSFVLDNVWDTTAPTANVAFEPDLNTPSPYKVVTIEASDENLSDTPIAVVKGAGGIPHENSDEWTFVNRHVLDENADYHIYVRDRAGNVLEWINPETGTSTITIDTIDHTAPTSNGAIVEPSLDDSGEQKTYPGTDDQGNEIQEPYIKIIVDATDDDGTSDGLEYRLGKDLNDDGDIDDENEVIRDWQDSPVFDEIKDGGVYVVEVRDEAGNITRFKTEDINKDLVTGHLDSGELARIFGVSLSASPLSWTNGTVSLVVTGGDASGLLDPTAPFSYDNGATWTYERTKIIYENGTYSVLIKDIYGNTYTSGSLPIENIDAVAPTLTATPSSRNNAININASDELSSLDRITYSINGGVEKALEVYVDGVYTDDATLTVTQQGLYIIYAYDKAGNCTTRELNITGTLPDNPLFDGTADEIATRISSYITQSPTEWTKSNVTLSVSIPDTTGLSTAPYSWDGGTNYISNQNYTVSQNGTYTLVIKDMYGNTYTSQPVTVSNIDKLAPTLSATQNGNTLMITSSDNQSGVARLAWVGGTITTQQNLQTYDVGQSNTSYAATLPSNGTFTIYAYDLAGNVNTISKGVLGVTTNNNNNNSGGGTSGNSGNNTHTIERITTIEKQVPVYIDKYVTVTPTPTPAASSTVVPASGTAGAKNTTTTTTASSSAPAGTAKTTSTSTKTTASTAKPSTTATKLTTDLVAASPITSGESVEETTVLADENLAKYRNSRITGSVTASPDSRNKGGFNAVFGIVLGLMALSAIAGGVYWYTTKYKPALLDGELATDDYEFAEDIALAQQEDAEGESESTT